ncbi:hypothetical protein ACIBO5_36445 [Nonomuraea angiospora]|uniref:hypothetical protein n=1 Tax=Nonomuraea angiospora TaxID=46172 RepID=UPI0037A4BD4B
MQAADKLKVGPEWRGGGDYVFTTGSGEPVHSDTVSSLFPILTKRYNEAWFCLQLPTALVREWRPHPELQRS